MDLLASKDFKNFVGDIKNLVKKAQYSALKAVNKELLELYWSIGKNIIEKQEEYGWGNSVVEDLSKELQREFEGVRGLSAQNI